MTQSGYAGASNAVHAKPPVDLATHVLVDLGLSSVVGHRLSCFLDVVI